MDKKAVILIADDCAQSRGLLRAVLEPEYTVLETTDSRGVYRVLYTQPGISVMLLHTQLHGESGLSLLREMRQDPGLQEVCVIITDREASLDTEEQALAAGAMDYIALPCRTAILQRRVQNIITCLQAEQGRRLQVLDPLTQIYTREMFYERTRTILQQHTDEAYVLVRWDIHRFKVVNELFGTAVGDEILCEIGRRFALTLLHKNGTYGRLEADHFATCFPRRYLNPEKFIAYMNSLTTDLGLHYELGLYAGIYLIDDITVPIDLMCDRANLALRTVKGNYLTRFAYYDEAMRQNLLAEQRLIAEAGPALERQEFSVYLQPIYNLCDEAPVGAEALVRWQHPEKGCISPAEFIPLFERNGYITQLDAYVWENVCRFLAARRAAGKPLVPISVNVSRIDLYHPDICGNLCALVQRYDLSPSLLKLEITESAYIENPHQLLQTIAQLRAQGFPILMDDFGSGYSSLNMLKDFTVDILKVDMRFLDGLQNSNRAASVVTSVVRMAKWLKMRVIAEGVETQAQVDFLRSIGCDSAQGYFFSHPLQEDAFSALLDNAPMIKEPALPRMLMERFDFEMLLSANPDLELLLGGMIGAMALYELRGDALEVVRVNNDYYTLMDTTPHETFAGTRNVLSFLSAEDQAAFLGVCRAALHGGVESATLQRRRKDGSVLWLHMRVRCVGQYMGGAMMYVAMHDVTQQHDFEQKRQLTICLSSLRSIFSEIYVLDYPNNRFRVLQVHNKLPELLCKDRPLDEALAAILNSGIVHPDSLPEYTRLLQPENIATEIAASGRGCAVQELRVRDSTGRFHWISRTLVPLPEDGGNAFLSCCTDVSSQHSARHALAEAALLRHRRHDDQRYEIILDQTGTAVFEWDLESGEFFAAKHFYEYMVSRIDPQDLLAGRNCEAVMDPRDFEKFRFFVNTCEALRTEAFSGTRSFTTHLRLKTTQDTYVWAKLSSTFVKDEQQKLVRVINTINNFNDEAESILALQRNLQASEAQVHTLEQLYNAIPCAILQRDLAPPHTILHINQAARALLGTAIICKNPQDSEQFIHPDDRALFRQAAAECQRSGATTLTLRLLPENGHACTVLDTLSITQNFRGENVLQSVFLDITAQLEQRQKLSDTTQMLHDLIRNLPSGVGIYEIDAQITPLLVSDSMYRIFGDTPQQHLVRLCNTKSIVQVLKDAPGAPLREAFSARIDTCFEQTMPAVRQDGTHIWVRTCGVFRALNEKVLVYVTVADVSENVRSERARLRESEMCRLIVESSDLLVFDYDTEADVMSYSLTDGAMRRTITLPDYLSALPHSNFIHPDYRCALHDALHQAMQSAAGGTLELMADYSGCENWHWYRLIYNAVTDKNETFRILGRAQDIHSEKVLAKRAECDGLTGMLNRAAAEQKIEEALSTDDACVLYLYDIDNFKAINDTYGHAEGDRLLTRIATILHGSFRTSDVIGRLGGDELVVMMRSVPAGSPLIAHKAKETLDGIRALSKEFGWDCNVSVSLGGALFPAHGSDFATLYRAADKALYASKKSGKSRFTLAP